MVLTSVSRIVLSYSCRKLMNINVGKRCFSSNKHPERHDIVKIFVSEMSKRQRGVAYA
jgi:hypothetical protein